jgi:hypothetical protein
MKFLSTLVCLSAILVEIIRFVKSTTTVPFESIDYEHFSKDNFNLLKINKLLMVIASKLLTQY